MALGPRGTVFVGSMSAGKVHAVIDRNGDHKADRVVVIASGLNQPNGVAVHNGALYVATRARSFGSTTSSSISMRRRRLSSSVTACRTRALVTRGSSSPSAPTTCCTCRSGAPCNVVPVAANGVDHSANEARRIKPRGVRRGCAQHRRIRLASEDPRAVVHRQRSRHARRRRAERRAQCRVEARHALRIPVLSSG